MDVHEGVIYNKVTCKFIFGYDMLCKDSMTLSDKLKAEGRFPINKPGLYNRKIIRRYRISNTFAHTDN